MDDRDSDPIRERDRSGNQTGPWALALGALAVGVGAVATEALRRRRSRSSGADSDRGTESVARTDPTDHEGSGDGV
ncbi:hypothetical protein BRC94_01385 [Halobacteriales archaeon QS_5_70_17]|jgi:hypothetical protein|nr:MAG: hypothetical protein BRC94_01385 [Halobacteriales archaeon QS_5_70_17]